MSAITTGTVTGFSDDTALLQSQADIRRETAVESKDIIDAVKTSGWANSDRTGTEADRVVAQGTAYFIASQQNDFSNATALAALKSTQDLQFASTQAAIQLAAEKQATAAALATAATQLLVVQEAVKGREMQEKNLIDNLRAELEKERAGHRHWESTYYQAQNQSLTAQLQAFQSQFQAATQGTVNFGTMSGNAGRNTSTNNIV